MVTYRKMAPWVEARNLWTHSIDLAAGPLVNTIFIIAGVWVAIRSSHTSVGGGLTRTNAHFISQSHVVQFIATSQVKVQFTTLAKPMHGIVAYIYPWDEIQFKTDQLIPIQYLASRPTQAYFAGPGGDVNYPASWPLEIVGLAIVLFGAASLIQQLHWSRRVVKLISAASDQGHTIRARLHNSGGSSVVVAAASTTPWQLTWRVLVIDTKVSPYSLRQFRKVWSRRRRVLPGTAQAGTRLGVSQWIVIRSGDFIYLPLTSAAPVSLARKTRSLPKSDSDPMFLHHQLLSAYADVLDRVQQLPPVFRASGKRYSRQPHPEFRTFLCLRFLVRFHAETHIRRQLQDLAKIYTRKRFMYAPTEDVRGDYLAKLSDECSSFNNALSNGSRPIAAIVVMLTIVTPIIPIILKTSPVPISIILEALFYFAAAAIILLPGTLAVIAYNNSFRFKRQAFGADLSGIKPRKFESIYELENRLYGQLGQRKRTEGVPDLWLRATVIIILCVFFAIFFIKTLDQLSILAWLIIGSVMIFLTWSFMKSVRYRSRAER